MQDPISTGTGSAPERAIIDARTPTEAQAAIVMVQAASDDKLVMALADKFQKKPWYARTEVWAGLISIIGPNVAAMIFSPSTLAITLPSTVIIGAAYILANAGISKQNADGMAQVLGVVAKGIVDKKKA